MIIVVEATKTGAIAATTQDLIGFKGLILTPVSTTLSYDDQITEADSKLTVNRMNCKGMDEVAKALATMLDTVDEVCKDIFDDDCDVGNVIEEASEELIDKTLTLTKAASINLADPIISTSATSILGVISLITKIKSNVKSLITSQVATMKTTVLIYVSQISIIESAKFEIGGAITFPGATPLPDDENDFAGQIPVLEEQLSNLMICGNANDRVIESISQLERQGKERGQVT